jgi:hypothetical protein
MGSSSPSSLSEFLSSLRYTHRGRLHARYPQKRCATNSRSENKAKKLPRRDCHPERGLCFAAAKHNRSRRTLHWYARLVLLTDFSTDPAELYSGRLRSLYTSRKTEVSRVHIPSVVHPLGSLLAASSLGPDHLPLRLAVSASVPHRWHRSEGSFGGDVPRHHTPRPTAGCAIQVVIAGNIEKNRPEYCGSVALQSREGILQK